MQRPIYQSQFQGSREIKHKVRAIELEEPSDYLAECSVGRRAFLSRLTAAGLGVSALGLAASADAAGFLQPALRTSDLASHRTMDEKQFRLELIGSIEFSLAAGEIALAKSAHRHVRELASFDVAKASALSAVLRELGTPSRRIDHKTKAILARLKAAPQGGLFDSAYVEAQLENLIVSRDLTKNYLQNSSGQTAIVEIHARHLATLSLATFSEHITLASRILKDLKA